LKTSKASAHRPVAELPVSASELSTQAIWAVLSKLRRQSGVRNRYDVPSGPGHGRKFGIELMLNRALTMQVSSPDFLRAKASCGLPIPSTFVAPHAGAAAGVYSQELRRISSHSLASATQPCSI